jgi:hypothetical protein
MAYQENHTLQSRALTLLTRCKKAIRLYSRSHKHLRTERDKLAEVQIARWREANEQLFGDLFNLLSPSARKDIQLRREIELIESRYAVVLRGLESEFERKRGELQRAIDREEFIVAAELSAVLVSSRATVQASRAALSELRGVLQRGGEKNEGGGAYLRNAYERQGGSELVLDMFDEDFFCLESQAEPPKEVRNFARGNDSETEVPSAEDFDIGRNPIEPRGKVIPLRR